MKIFTSTQIKELDKYTIDHEPIKSVDLMERAARALTTAITEECGVGTPLVVFAGHGNNGGDALAVARLLALRSYDVTVYLFNINNKLSEDCNEMRQRALECKEIKHFVEVTREFDPPQLTAGTVVIDGLFGTGLSKPLETGFASLVKYINQSPCRVISIDMPSGLMSESNTYNIHNHIIRADVTLTLHTRKLALLFADNQPYVGRLRVLDIGLSSDYINKTDTAYTIQEASDLRPLVIPRSDFAHKGTMGHALLIAGSYGMAGAAVLSTRACLRSGAGKVTVHTPKYNCDIMQISVPEAVIQLDDEDTYFSEDVPADEFDALGIGPGLGQLEGTAIALIAQLRRSQAPIVVDADALNILGSHRAWMQQLPKHLILTPHPREFDRLSGSRSSDDYERLMKAVDMAVRLQVFIILKGHYSALCTPDGKVIFNSTGNSGMATAGSGDVLTGIITALLARGYHQREACQLGMYLHGLAGDLAVCDKGKECLVASDIIDYLPEAFRTL
jgi:NAD(P)H-hydrate epimerase